MKRITVITPANGVWTLAKQPFARCLLLASVTGVVAYATFPRLIANIFDASGNVIWRQSVNILSSDASNQISNVTFAVQGCETASSQSFPAYSLTDFGVPLPDDLTILANLTLTITLENYISASDTTPYFIVTTDDPFLDGARPFDDLQAP